MVPKENFGFLDSNKVVINGTAPRTVDVEESIDVQNHFHDLNIILNTNQD